MSKAISRLLVLVEDTPATSRFWPSWQRYSIEPLLRLISEGQFGVYEFCLVAYSSTDGQSNALLQKTSWTTNCESFSRTLNTMKFEGTCGEHALAEALSEAVYLSRQPSAFAALNNIEQHLLICTSGSVGRLPYLWPYDDKTRELYGFQILPQLSQFGLTLSFLTERDPNGIFFKCFAKIAGINALNDSVQLSKGLGYLSMIHPDWRHGKLAMVSRMKVTAAKQQHQQKVNCHQQQQHSSDQTSTSAYDESSSSAKTSVVVQTVDRQNGQKQDVEEGPVFQSEKTQSQVQEIEIDGEGEEGQETDFVQASSSSSKMQDDPLIDAVDLSSWENNGQNRGYSNQQEFCSIDIEDNDFEDELLGLTQRKKESTERKRKIKDDAYSIGQSNGEHGCLGHGGRHEVCSPVSFSSAIENSQNKTTSIPTTDSILSLEHSPFGMLGNQNQKSEGVEDLVALSTAINPTLVRSIAPVAATTHDHPSSGYPPMSTTDRTKTLSSAASISIESKGAVLLQQEQDSSSVKCLYERLPKDDNKSFHDISSSAYERLSTTLQPIVGPDFHSTLPSRLGGQYHHLTTMTKHQHQHQHQQLLPQHQLPYQQNQSKRLRTTPGPRFSVTNNTILTAPFLHYPNKPLSLLNEATDSMIENPQIKPMPHLDSSLNSRSTAVWRGPIFVSCPSSFDPRNPVKAFDVEINGLPHFHPLNCLMHRELIAHSLHLGDRKHFFMTQTVQWNKQSITREGHVFLSWLYERGVHAVIDLESNGRHRLILFAQTSTNGDQKLLVGYNTQQCI